MYLPSIVILLPTLIAASPIFTPRQLAPSDTEYDLVNGSPCKAVTIIFARGTLESGNVGSLAGPPFFSAVADAIGAANLAVQGVEYPADILGFLAGGDAAGSQTMADLTLQAFSQCPSTKVVLSGYSQGGQLVHNAANLLSSATQAKVNSVVIFGDPDNGDPVGRIPASKVDIICHDTDNICQGGSLVLASHLTYSDDAPAAAAFVKAHTGL